jgi:hypothetical protein
MRIRARPGDLDLPLAEFFFEVVQIGQGALATLFLFSGRAGWIELGCLPWAG